MWREGTTTKRSYNNKIQFTSSQGKVTLIRPFFRLLSLCDLWGISRLYTPILRTRCSCSSRTYRFSTTCRTSSRPWWKQTRGECSGCSRRRRLWWERGHLKWINEGETQSQGRLNRGHWASHSLKRNSERPKSTMISVRWWTRRKRSF